MIGFVHIPRTAGTYIEHLFEDMPPEKFVNFFGIPTKKQGANKITLIERVADDANIQKKLLEHPNMATCEIFSGHFSMNIKKFLPPHAKDAEYITILRQPLYRLVSFANKVTSSRAFRKVILGDEPKWTYECWLRFVDYVKNNATTGLMPHERNGFSNYMCKVFAGLDLSKPNLTVTDKTLDNAKKALDKFKYVGLFENLEKALTDITAMFTGTKPFEVIPSTTTLPREEIVKELTALNQFDIQLYEYILNKTPKKSK